MSMAVSVNEPDTTPTMLPTGRLREPSVPQSDRNMALAIHLTPLLFIALGPLALVIPLILWLVRKQESAFVDDHGREVVNFYISCTIYHVILGLLSLVVVGLILMPILWIVIVVSLARGASASNSGEYFRYPMTIRFLS